MMKTNFSPRGPNADNPNEDDEILKNDFNNKKITFIKKQYQYLYNDNNIDVKPDHIAKYYIKYS